jgi:PEP-CTERM/exosortase A-associated glycosyltransferase
VLNGIAALQVGHRLGIPVLYEVRAFWEDAAVDHGTATAGGLRYRLSRALETYVLRRADAVTVICEGLRRDIVQRGIYPDKITVIPNGVDLRQFPGRRKRDPDLARRLGLDGKQTVGFIGSFYAYEGIAFLLEALPALLSEHDNVRVLLVGGGPQEERLKQQTRDLGISEHVVFAGRVPHYEVQSFYDLVDIFIYPRVRIRLTELVTPLKPLEAMAQGALVVASDVGGHLELIEDGKTGTLFEAGNSAALVRALSDILKRPESWQQMSQRARDFVKTKRTWRLSVFNYLDVYRSVVERG